MTPDQVRAEMEADVQRQIAELVGDTIDGRTFTGRLSNGDPYSATIDHIDIVGTVTLDLPGEPGPIRLAIRRWLGIER